MIVRNQGQGAESSETLIVEFTGNFLAVCSHYLLLTVQVTHLTLRAQSSGIHIPRLFYSSEHKMLYRLALNCALSHQTLCTSSQQ